MKEVSEATFLLLMVQKSGDVTTCYLYYFETLWKMGYTLSSPYQLVSRILNHQRWTFQCLLPRPAKSNKAFQKPLLLVNFKIGREPGREPEGFAGRVGMSPRKIEKMD